MSNTIKATAVQMASGPNIDANLLEAQRLVKEAAKEGSKLVVLPENFAYVGKRCSDILQIGEQAGHGPLQDFLHKLAAKYKIWLVGGTIPLATEKSDKVRASCLTYNDKGEIVARYDKMHLFDVDLIDADESYAESKTFEAGDTPVVVESPFGNIGIAVCYDLRFPELFRNLADKGMDIIAMPAAFTAVTGKAHWEPLVRARAIENLSYMIAAAQGGYHISGRETHGQSMIVDPWGAVLAQVPRGSGYITSTLDLDLLKATRKNFPSLDHRRLRCK